MKGSVIRRGKKSWRVKFDLGRDPLTGKRQTTYQTFRGTKREAETKLAELITAAENGVYVTPDRLTLGDYLRAWLEAPVSLSPKTVERYRQLSEQQIIPHLGGVALQKLTPAHVQEWHAELLASGGKDGRPLSARTVGHAHRVLHRALARAVEGQKVFRNVVSIVKPPKVEEKEIQILTAGQIGGVIEKLREHPIYPIVVVALGTGLRRGELLALQWADVDLGAASLQVERSVEETKGGLRFKSPKSKHGRRSVSLPPIVVETLRDHRRRQLEVQLSLGLGKLPDEALVFSQADGSPMSPNNLSRDWRRLVISRKFPRVSFHGLRHSHVSALIDGGLDVFSVSRRIGHGSAALTLRTYTHLFSKKDTEAADAIEAALRTRAER